MDVLLQRYIVSIFLIIGLSVTGQAQTKTAGTGNWDNPATWSPSGVPGDGDVILIPSGSEVRVRDDYTLNDAILIIEGELEMYYRGCGFLCFDYGSLIFTGPDSGVIIEEGGTITDNTWLGRDALFISVDGTEFWTGENCSTCGIYEGTQTFLSTVTQPLGLTNPLPVEMLYFAAGFSKGAVSLSWATASELNNSHFDIERSVDGLDFYHIGEVPGAGNATALIEYSFQDDQLPFTASRLLYYRLKQVDFDGQYEYSKVVAVHNEVLDLVELRTWPNPFVDQLTVLFHAPFPDNIALRVCNTEGQEVFSRMYPVDEGLNELKIDELHDSPPGVYSLYLMGNSLQYKEKVIRAR